MPPEVQKKITKKGFKGKFPEPRKSITPDDLQALGRDIDRKISFAHEDLKRDMQALGATAATILALLVELKESRKE